MEYDQGIRKRCETRLEGLKNNRTLFEPQWSEVARLAQPYRSRFLDEKPNQKTEKRINSNIRNGHGIRAVRTLRAGLYTGLSAPSKPWFKLEPYDRDLLSSSAVTTYLAACEDRIYALFARTNFYPAMKAGYGELGLFGCDAGVMVEHKLAGLVTNQLTAGEFWLGLNDTGSPGALYREIPLTVNQAVQTFGDKTSQRVRNLYDQSKKEEPVLCYQAIEQNDGRDASKMDGKNKPWRSVYWEADTSCTTALSISGFEEQPFYGARWETTGGDTYGTSPGMDALPDLREMMLHTRRKGTIVGQIARPHMRVPPNIGFTGIVEGGVTAIANVDADAVRPLYTPDYRAVQLVGEDVSNSERKVDEAFFADLFMAITNMPGIQPRQMAEIASRNEEKLTQLGPVVESVNQEKLQVSIDRAYAMLDRNGGLPDPPPELNGQPLRIVFISILTQMQRMVGAGSIERMVSFVGNMGAAFPEALLKLDADAAIEEYASVIGTPPRILRDAKVVAEMRAQQAQQAQMAQMAQMAPAAKDAADAARLLSEADTGDGQSILQRLTGQAQAA